MRFKHQPHNIILRVISLLGPQIEHLPTDLRLLCFQAHDDTAHHITDVDERARVSALVDDEFTFGEGFQHKLIDDQVKAGARRNSVQGGKTKQRGAQAASFCESKYSSAAIFVSAYNDCGLSGDSSVTGLPSSDKP
jgi:hypothetical protein